MAQSSVPDLGLNIGLLRHAIQKEYTGVALDPTGDRHFIVGRVVAEEIGYDPAVLHRLPPVALESFAGVANPFAWGSLREGEVVADLGSGAGLDSILAAEQVGASGRVIGVDMTDAMLEKARTNAALVGATKVEFRKGYLEELPIEDASVDVVISNGVINLCPDKLAVYREIFRVLKPGGRFQIADILVDQPVPDEAKEDIDVWTG